jgi:uncharacterized protein (DUF2249 family)
MNTTTPSTIDVRQISPGQRHGLISERLAALDAGDALLLVNDHDPVPLRRQLDTQWPGQFEYAYLESCPDLWRLEIRRAATPSNAGASTCCSGGACGG